MHGTVAVEYAAPQCKGGVASSMPWVRLEAPLDTTRIAVRDQFWKHEGREVKQAARTSARKPAT
jgi:hypothetical protein